eukprot:COSAG06_NODE_48168_length_334_cov_0.659574_1_plen_58_part_10
MHICSAVVLRTGVLKVNCSVLLLLLLLLLLVAAASVFRAATLFAAGLPLAETVSPQKR